MRPVLAVVSVILVTCAWALTAPGALAQSTPADEEARVHFRLGTAYYESGRFTQAAEEFQKAYDLSKRSPLLYNLFLAWRDAGELEKAAKALELFLEKEQHHPDREKLTARLASLKKILAERGSAAEAPPASEAQQGAGQEGGAAQPPEEAPAPEEAEQDQQPQADVTAQGSPPERKPDYIPWVVMGGGGALVVGGLITGMLAKKDEDAVADACPDNVCTDPADLDRADAGKTKALVADILVGAGIATAAVGLVFVFWKPWQREVAEPPAQLGFGCARGGCAASLRGRF